MFPVERSVCALLMEKFNVIEFPLVPVSVADWFEVFPQKKPERVEEQSGRDGLSMKSPLDPLSKKAVAEEIRCRIEEEGIGVRPEANTHDQGMTISIGISAGNLSSEDLFDEFYNLADQALYLAKKEGRNRTRAIHLDDTH